MARLNLLEETRYEKLPVSVFANQKEASLSVARRIAELIRTKQAKGRAGRTGPGYRGNPDRRLCRTGAHAPPGRAEFPKRDHL